MYYNVQYLSTYNKCLIQCSCLYQITDTCTFIPTSAVNVASRVQKYMYLLELELSQHINLIGSTKSYLAYPRDCFDLKRKGCNTSGIYANKTSCLL